MSTVPDPYKVEPGDLITAELFNGVQDKIDNDIDSRVKKAIDAITKVQQAGDSEKLGGKTPAQIEEAIIERALAQIPKRTGYKMIFKRLQVNKPETVTHELKAFPLVDAYQLDYFEVVCADHEEKENKFVNFYLYHSDETELKSTIQGDRRKLIIESSEDGQFVFKIQFYKMLDLLGIKYTPSQSIGDVVTEFWQELFKKPSDKFDVDQYCNSPWFEKCCGENRSIALLKQRDNWDELWFQMRARKRANFPYPLVGMPVEEKDWLAQFPNNLEVVHLDFDNIGVNLLQKPFYPLDLRPSTPTDPEKINRDELKVMLLLKV